MINFIKIFKKSGFFNKSYKNERKNNANEIMHFPKNNNALIMLYRALLQMPVMN